MSGQFVADGCCKCGITAWHRSVLPLGAFADAESLQPAPAISENSVAMRHLRSAGLPEPLATQHSPLPESVLFAATVS